MKKLKKAMQCISFVLAMAVMMSSMIPEAGLMSQVEAASVKLSKTKLTLTRGEKTSLTVKGTKKKVTWSSSNTKVATVSKGIVKAKNEGTAVITAKVGKKKLTCSVTVQGNYKVLYKALLEKGTVSIKTDYGTSTYLIKSFYLLDIDKNGVPELIVKDGSSSETFSNRFIYTVKKGKVVYCGEYYVKGDRYLYYNSKYKAIYIWWWTNGVGGSGAMLVRLSGTKMKNYKYIWTGSEKVGSTKQIYMYGTSGIKAKKVSKKKFNSMLKKYFKGQKKYSFMNNTSANRKKKLG